MNDDVYAVCDWLLGKRRRPAVVYCGERSVLSCNIRDCVELEGAEHHRPRALDPDKLRVRQERTFDIRRLEIEKQRVLDSKPSQILCEADCRAVRVVYEEDMIAGFQQSHEYGADGGYSRPECFARLAALECRKLFFQYLYCGILSARVDVVVAFIGVSNGQSVEIRKRKE